MEKNNKVKSLYYFDAVLREDITPEEREEQLEKLKEESEKLTEWPET
ncbi:MAG: hypothetical protein PUC05_02880 [Firmicutes bacterium]|nr:hypothetical protein [Bacillota bacterium]